MDMEPKVLAALQGNMVLGCTENAGHHVGLLITTPWRETLYGRFSAVYVHWDPSNCYPVICNARTAVRNARIPHCKIAAYFLNGYEDGKDHREAQSIWRQIHHLVVPWMLQ